jgi:hypothetical protein
MISKNLKLKIVFICILILLVSLGVYSLLPKKIQKSVSSPTIAVNYSNFEKVLSKSSMIKDLPNEGEILLKFYNFNTGERVFEKTFLLKKERIVETEQKDSEIIILLHSKYLKELTNKNLCNIFKKANLAGDLSIETNLSKTSLSWKFKSMIKYLECLS